ncbi:MAG TPA: MBL fold metallo-hydrolase [Polyangia bacterium]|nr:MBL fold metallo-hydrolase [Polyangia bacterium]
MPTLTQARPLTLWMAALAAAACSATTHAVRPAKLGTPTSATAMETLLDQPGPIEVETVVGADWAVTRAGLINLDDPKAKAAGLKDGDEPIQIYTHVIRHPTRGTFLIDAGVSRKMVEDPAGLGIGWVVRKYLHPERIHVRTDTATLERRLPPLAGVLLTHIHLDHIGGLPDVPREVPIFGGPGDSAERELLFMFSQGTMDRVLAGHDAIQELPFTSDPSGRFAGVIDLFGDGSLFAILVPGHTAGSVAYVARTARGPVLFTGDTSHTRWGWDHDVAPGTFSSDRARNGVSLAALRELAARHPSLDVRLGHQR